MYKSDKTKIESYKTHKRISANLIFEMHYHLNPSVIHTRNRSFKILVAYSIIWNQSKMGKDYWRAKYYKY